MPSFKSTQRQLTVMLVTICCAAVCLQLPYTTLYLLNAAKWSLWPQHWMLHAKLYLCRKVADMIATSNYAVNFVLYCVSGSLFRHAVHKLCSICWRRQQQQQQQHDSRHRHHETMSTTAVTLVNAGKAQLDCETEQ